MNETWSQFSRCPKSRVQLEVWGGRWEKARDCTGTNTHQKLGTWAKGLTSLSSSFPICKMQLLMPTSCGSGEIGIMYKVMYKVIWGVSQCIVGMQYHYSCFSPRAGKQKIQEDGGPNIMPSGCLSQRAIEIIPCGILCGTFLSAHQVCSQPRYVRARQPQAPSGSAVLDGSEMPR